MSQDGRLHPASRQGTNTGSRQRRVHQNRESFARANSQMSQQARERGWSCGWQSLQGKLYVLTISHVSAEQGKETFELTRTDRARNQNEDVRSLNQRIKERGTVQACKRQLVIGKTIDRGRRLKRHSPRGERPPIGAASTLARISSYLRTEKCAQHARRKNEHCAGFAERNSQEHSARQRYARQCGCAAMRDTSCKREGNAHRSLGHGSRKETRYHKGRPLTGARGPTARRH